MKSPVACTLLLAATFLSGCGGDSMSEIGFSLPPGDPQAGRDTFLYMQCNQCHTVYGEDLPEVPFAQETPYVQLGGPVTSIKTYGQLVTGIINPSHELADGYAEEVVSEDGESNMYIYNRYMTVQELIDIVMFLQPHYAVVAPNTNYRVYP